MHVFPHFFQPTGHSFILLLYFRAHEFDRATQPLENVGRTLLLPLEADLYVLSNFLGSPQRRLRGALADLHGSIGQP